MVLDLKTHSHAPFARQNRDLPERKKLVIFTGESFVAHQHLRDLLPFLAENNIEPVIFLTPSCDLPKANTPSMQKFFFYEEGIFTDVIYPALDAQRANGKNTLTPTFNQMAAAYRLSPVNIENASDPRVSAALDDPASIGVISIYQDMIFKTPFIESVKDRGLFFWNLHPALLPQHRGVLVAFWSQMHGETRHGYTLHELEAGIDTGRIISRHEGRLVRDKSAVENYFSFTRGGSDLVKEALAEFLEFGRPSYEMKTKGSSSYYSFPTEEDVAAGKRRGARLWGTPQEMHDLYLSYFGNEKLLSRKIKDAIAQIEGTDHLREALFRRPVTRTTSAASWQHRI